MQYFLMKLQKLITRISKKNSKFLFTRCKNKLQLTQFNNFLADNSLINVTIKTPYKLNFTLSSIWSSFSLLFRAVYSFSILKRHEKYVQIIKMTNINTCIRFKFSLIIMWCVYMYNSVSITTIFVQQFIVDCSLSPLCPLPLEKFSRYDLQPITEQQDPTALLYPVISFFMSLEWWHEQMTFHLKVKQVYIQNTLHLSLSELMRCLGGKHKDGEISTTPPPTFWFGHIH